MGVWYRVPTILETLGGPALWDGERGLESRSSPLVTVSNLVVKRHRRAGDPPDELGPSCPHFQGYSGSSEPTQFDRLRMTSY